MHEHLQHVAFAGCQFTPRTFDIDPEGPLPVGLASAEAVRCLSRIASTATCQGT